jgi:two-component system catabolic regulation response regulator CreB
MKNLPRILVIEDEPAIADTLVYALRTEGFAPVWRSTGAAGLRELAANECALVVLDVGLPDTTGFELCKAIRSRWPVPILFLTARNGEVDRVLGLELGGDDYVTKPFSPREVTARIRAILRRGSLGQRANGASPAGAPPTRGAPGRFSHDAAKCEIRFHGERLDLTRYEYRLLKALLAQPGRVFTRDDLMTVAWEDPASSLDRTVDAHIKTLRAKLRAVAPEADPIETRRGLGYALRAAS